MKKSISFLLLLKLFSLSCYAQIYIEPVVGYGLDLNNTFKHINTAVQLSWPTKTSHEFLLRLERGWGLSSSLSDSSYTLNPSLPLYASADKRILPEILSLASGLRLKVSGAQTKDIFSVLMFAGLSYQKVNVSYQYDKGNYVILNPDKTEDRLGAFVSGGIEYMHLLRKGRVFFQVLVATSPIGRKSKYPSSFGLLAPLTINAGYSIPLSKTSHEKE